MKCLLQSLVVLAVAASGATAPAAPQPVDREPSIQRQQAAVARFVQEYPGVRLAKSGERIERVYGMPFGFGDTPEQAAEQFIAVHSEMFGVARAELTLQHERRMMHGKFTAVSYGQTYNGVPVHRAWVTVLTRSDLGNAVVLASPNLYDLSGAELDPVVIAGAQVLAEMQRRYRDFTFTKPELVVYMDGRGEEATPMYAYRFRGGNRELDPPEWYEFMVDASSEDTPIVNLESLIRFEDVVGTVTGMGTTGELPDRGDNLPVEKPMEDIWVRIVGGNAGYTSSSGDYVISNGGTSGVTVEASVAGIGGTQAGRWVRVDNFAGGELSMSQGVTPPGPADFLFNSSPTEYNTAQINGFIFTTDVHNFVVGIDPSYPFTFELMPCVVNRNDYVCPGNAWYDGGSINFCRAQSGYPNTAFSSVVYHEYGHHIVDSGHPFATGDYHEGMSDVTASLLMDTNCLGRGFSGGNFCLRNAYNSITYPCSAEAHTCGQVLSGAFWLTRDELVVTEPVNYLGIIRALYLGSILLQPPSVTPAITIDVLTLDDDNGDLTDGTPHLDEICTGFGAKNLDCPAAIGFDYPDGRPLPLNPNQDTTFRVNVVPVLVMPVSGTGELHYSLDGAPFVTVSMNETATDEYEATLPGAPCDSRYNWYVSAEGAGAGTINDPEDAPTTTYVSVVATGTTVAFEDDFNTDKGWTVVNSGGLTDGPWERAIPAGGGDRGDPPTDFDGSGWCYVTDNADGNSDVDDGTTRLVSPTIDLSGGDAQVHYALWYTNYWGNDPNNDTFKVHASNDDGATWTLVETIGPATSSGWTEHTFIVGDYVVPNNQVKVRFSASDLSAGSVVEAGIDDFSVSVFTCVADADGDGVPDAEDNCPNDFNPGQEDADGDNVGDACDGCPNEPALVDPSEPDGEVTCDDGIDNDCDGLTDGADQDCAAPGCPYTCGDINGDLVSDLSDFTMFASCFGMLPSSSQECLCSDLNGDDVINLADFTLFATLFGIGSTNSPPNCP